MKSRTAETKENGDREYNKDGKQITKKRIN